MPQNQSSSTGIRWAGGALLLAIGVSTLVFIDSENLRGQVQSVEGPGAPVLGACTGREEEDLYEIDRESLMYPEEPDVIDLWSSRYHERVEQVVDEYLQNAEREIDCLSSDIENLVPPGQSMLSLASQLPPWEESSRHAELGHSDTPAVLLEYLRTYECALMERYFFLFGDVNKEMREIFEREDMELTWSEITQEFVEQERKIRYELSASRPALHRVLTATSGRGRMSGLDMEAECFYRASMDLRNAMAMAAEASACFPRVQDVKDPLRDPS